MASSPISTVLEQFHVSPPPAAVGDKLLPLNFFDFFWLNQPPVHYLFFYDLPISESHFTNTILPHLKHSLSITLQHFYPFAGNLIVFPTSTKKPEIRYLEGDSVTVTSAKCNLDYNELIANHPRDCEMFYHLVPLLGHASKTSDYVKIPVFTIQVTLFPNHGISIGLTNHHSLGDARTRFSFLNAWTSIARSGTHELITLPFYDRMFQDEKLDESYLKFAKVETFNEEYKPETLSGPTDKLRATFILTRNVINELKKLVSTQFPTLEYVSSFTVACGYIWSCIAKSKNDELQIFGFPVDCRERIMNPPIPISYFGNCIGWCGGFAKASLLAEKNGFVTAAKLLGENLHKTLSDKDGIVKDVTSMDGSFPKGVTRTITGVAGSPKLKYYDMDFGWGKPRKLETVSIDYRGAISMNSCRESDQDLEIGVCLIKSEMDEFVRVFDEGLKELC